MLAVRALVVTAAAAALVTTAPALVGASSARARSEPPGLIAFESTSGSRVQIVVEAGSGAHPRLLLRPSPVQLYQPAWSRDGRLLAFVGLVHGDPTTAEILVSTPSGKKLRQLTHNVWEDDFPSWSPDGRHVAFYSSRPAGTGIWIMDSDGSHQRLLAPTSNSVSWAPAWSPNGKEIAFVSGLGSQAEIYTIRPDGRRLRELTHDSSFDIDPAWSPSGRQLAFGSTRAGRAEIWVMKADGREQRRLTTHASRREHEGVGHPTWSADGKWIAFARTDGGGHSRIYLVTTDGREHPLAGGYAQTGADPAFSPSNS